MPIDDDFISLFDDIESLDIFDCFWSKDYFDYLDSLDCFSSLDYYYYLDCFEEGGWTTGQSLLGMDGFVDYFLIYLVVFDVGLLSFFVLDYSFVYFF